MLAVFDQYGEFFEWIDADSIARRSDKPAARPRQIGRSLLPTTCLLTFHLLFRRNVLTPLEYHPCARVRYRNQPSMICTAFGKGAWKPSASTRKATKPPISHTIAFT